MKVVVEKDKSKLIERATQELANLFDEHKDKHLLFLTSGGSSFDLLTSLQVSVEHISIGVLDERFNASPGINNFAQLSRTEFFKKSQSLFEEVLDTRFQDGEVLETFADRYEGLLKAWRTKHADGIIIAILGMGPDGHTSGIMPYPENEALFNSLFVDTTHWVVGYDAGGKNPYPQRATTAIPFLKNEIDYAVAYIAGENKQSLGSSASTAGLKRDALTRVLAKEGKLNETPARVLHEMKNVSVFTDIKIEA